MEEAIDALRRGTPHLNLVAYEKGSSGGELFSATVAKNRETPVTEDAIGIHGEAAAHEYAVGEEGCVAVAQHVRKSTALRTLTLHGSSDQPADAPGPKAIAEKGVLAMCAALHENASVTDFTIMSLNLTAAMCDGVAAALPKHPALRDFSLINNNFPIPESGRLAQALCASQVKSFTLTRNDLSGPGAELLCAGLVAAPLEELVLTESGVPHQGGPALALLLAKNRSLKRLVLSRNSLGDAGVSALAKGLRGNTTLEHLDLSLNDIGDAGATELSHALCGHPALTSLSYRSNNMTDAGAKAVARSIETDKCKLAELVLELNFIGEEGMEAVCRAVRGSPCLTLLDACGNSCFLNDALPGYTEALETMAARAAKAQAATQRAG
eukprot:TRINITY_DN31252_c0_g1_i1.p1 TRINITY_DN31252_c0_g1~~TRINITY_DN31252_c0_g1_i1.p1  ORF type:complete len:411 (+),score=142.15 TRINITY_DN31252_c0_g1_i1:90-1235(+)